MRFGTERVGVRGLAVLSAAGAVGVVLAVHGYGHRSLVAGTELPVSAPAKVTTAQQPRTKSTTPAGTSSTQPSGTTSTTTGSNQKLEPLLSPTQYASYAYQLYPGQESNQARLATAGFDVKVTPSSAGTIAVSVSGAGTNQGAQTSSYPASDHVYFIEASFGDDSGNSEYNGGDDGLVVTDATGRIVQ